MILATGTAVNVNTAVYSAGDTSVCVKLLTCFLLPCWICMDTRSSSRDNDRPPNVNGSDDPSSDGNSLDSALKPPHIFVERTLAMIKPDAVHKSSEIEDIIQRAGFTILNKRRIHLTPEQASEFYAEHFGKLFFPSLVGYMSSGPVIALVLAREKAVQYWRELIGPTNALKAKNTHPDSLRALYGTDDQRNGLHGSDSLASAEREIRFFFSESVIEPVAVGQNAKDYLSQSVNPTLLKALSELCKQKPLHPVIWLADWLVHNNPNKPMINTDPTPLVSEP
jgi:nucleoside diphosphate kinase